MVNLLDMRSDSLENKDYRVQALDITLNTKDQYENDIGKKTLVNIFDF